LAQNNDYWPLGHSVEDMGDVTIEVTRPWAIRPRPTPRTTPTIQVIAGPELLCYAALTPGQEVRIGREESCGLSLNDPSVSRNHALLRCDDEHTVTIQDLGSTNGTLVNNKPVIRTPLRVGDRIQIGNFCLRLDYMDADHLAHLGRLRRRLQAANRDSLTGLLSRIYLEEDLPGLVRSMDRTGAPFSVLFLDIDHFKRINDTFGHATGDEVLRGVVRLILLGIRDTDPAVRYGGEELVIFLPRTDVTGAEDVAERLRKAIANHDWRPVAIGMRVTASLGVARRRPDEPIADWLNRADEALYTAKSSGRNCTRLAP